MPPLKHTRHRPSSFKQATLFQTSANANKSSSSRASASPLNLSTRAPLRRRRLNGEGADEPGDRDSSDSSDVQRIKLAPAPTDLSEELASSKRDTLKSGSGSDSDQVRAAKRQRTTLKPRRPVYISDAEDIVDEVDETRILRSRLRSRTKKTAFQKNLEKLKRKKQGKPAVTSSSGSEDDDESEGEESDGDAPFKGAKKTSDLDSLFSQDSDEVDSDNFIVDDDEGGGDAAQLPTEFSMETYQDLSHQFKKIFQFFVHIAARPAKERRQYMRKQMKDEEYFRVPLQVTRRKISGMRDSLVASSVWRPGFKRALEKYPEFELVPLDSAEPSCDACHLGGRMSTLIGRLKGIPYERLGFEDSMPSGSGRSGSSSEPSSDDEDKEKVEFYLGRFCAKRTMVYHQFLHWEYTLFRCIVREVDELHEAKQSKGFYRVAYVGGKKPPEDLDDADAICDWLDERRIIDMEWRRMKDMMERARHLELSSNKDID